MNNSLKIPNNFLYCGTVDENGYNDCAANGCGNDDYCRCYTIESVSIDSINLREVANKINRALDEDVQQRRNQILNNILFDFDMNEVNTYCIKRLLSIKKIWNPENWIAEWGPSYYGDEVYKLSIQEDLFSDFISLLETVLNMNTLEEKINFLLELEYGSVTQNLIGKKYGVQNVRYEDIVFGQIAHHQKVKSKDLSYLKPTAFSGKMSSTSEIHGLVQFDGEKYRVVDGYHRLTFMQGGLGKSKHIRVIVAN